MTDIKFSDRYTLSLTKNTWTEKEIFLAKCLNFNINNLVIEVDLKTTAIKALVEFLKYAFQHIMTEDNYSVYKKELATNIKERYDELKSDFEKTCLSKVPYANRLRPVQVQSLFEMAYKRFNLLSFFMGGGKTITSATVSYMMQVKTTLVVCPVSAKWSIFRDLTEKWGYNPLYFTILDTKSSKTIQAFRERFVLVNYDILDKHMDYILNLEVGHIIFDEFHHAKNINTGKFKNCKTIVDKFSSARVTMLTGTPIRNRVNDLFSPFKISGNILGDNYQGFLKTFTNSAFNKKTMQNRVMGGKNLDFLSMAISNLMIRKTASEMQLGLPKKKITKYIIKDAEYKEEYNKIIDEMMLGESNMSLNGSLHSLNRLVSMAKINCSPGIFDLIDDILSQGDKVAVYSFYKECIFAIEERYKGRSVAIHGGIPSTKRDSLQHRFHNDPECTVFIGQHIAAGEIIDLTCAHNLIVCDIPMTPSELDQVYSRIHRPPQKLDVHVYLPIAEDSIDEDLYKLIAGKSVDINTTIDNGDKTVVNYKNIDEELFKKLIKKRKSL